LYKNFFQRRSNQAITQIHLLAWWIRNWTGNIWISNKKILPRSGYPTIITHKYHPGVMAFKTKDDEFFLKMMLENIII